MFTENCNPNDITKDDMKKLAEHIEEYIDTLEEVMIIPEEIMREYGEQIKSALKVSRKLVEKLKNGDRSVFKDEEDWNPIL